jgi:hypothetical protein
MKPHAYIIIAFVPLLVLILSDCKAQELQVKQAAAAVQGGCNQLEVRAPNCPGLEACFFWRKAYSGCENCVDSYHNGCYEIGEDYTPLAGPRVNVEEAVFYRFGQKVVSQPTGLIQARTQHILQAQLQVFNVCEHFVVLV